MSQFRSAFHFLLATGAKVLSGLLVIKLLAWSVGPVGFGLLSQLMGLVAIVGMLSGGGIANGVIKVLAQNRVCTAEGKRWMANAFAITLLFSAVLALVLAIASPFIVAGLLQGQFSTAIRVLAVAQVFVGIGTLLLAEASSRGDSRQYAAINVFGAVFGAALVGAGAFWFGLNGAAIAVALAPSMVGVLGLVVMVGSGRRRVLVRPRLEWKRTRHLMSFSTLTLVGALSVPLAQIYIRESMGTHYSWESVGYWQGAVRISDVYMQFIGVVLINHALPRFSTRELPLAVLELKRIVAWLLGFLAVSFMVFWPVKDFAIALVFSESFLPMGKYLFPQMVGDLFRTVAAAFSFFLLARGHIRVPLAFELAQGLGLLLGFRLLIGGYAEMAPVYAHVATYLVLAGVLGAQFRRSLFPGGSKAL